MEQTGTVGASVIQPAAAVRDLGVLLDQELSMTPHIAKVTSSCFYQLRQLRQIRRPVGQELVAQLVHSFVLSRPKLDYSNSVLTGLPKSTIMPLQHVQKAGARLIRPTDERARDASSEAAPLLARRPSSGLQIVHHDALNPDRSVSDVFFRHGACRRRQPDEVRSAIRRHRSIHSLSRIVALLLTSVRSHTPVLSPGPLAWNDLPPSLHCITDSKPFRKHLKTHYFNRTFVNTL